MDGPGKGTWTTPGKFPVTKASDFLRTMIMDQRFDQFTAVQFVIAIRVMHLKVMELQLLFAHLARVYGHLSVLRNVPGIMRIINSTPKVQINTRNYSRSC